MSLHDKTLLQQDTDFEIVKILLPFISTKTFLDIGAEKGTFSQLLTSQGFIGTLFEPLPKHEQILKKIANENNCFFSNYAIDSEDRTAEFHIACDDKGDTLDYFHSLNKLESDSRVKHTKSIPVTCRSLNSLGKEGIINQKIGIIKTDTEGNDLNVLKGFGTIDCDVIICEFFMPGIYSGWEQGSAYNLIEEAKKLGFEHFVAIKRIDTYEMVSIDTHAFIPKQWGNLIFIKKTLFEKTKKMLEKFKIENENQLLLTAVKNDEKLRTENNSLLKDCEERLSLINYLDSTAKDTIQRCKHQQIMINELNNSLARKIKRRCKLFITAKLGNLNQYPPRPLCLSENYYKNIPQNKVSNISIVTPSFNQGIFIERTMQSVFEQEFQALEYIVQDGGSNDGTIEVLTRHQDKLKHWDSSKDKGQSNAINLGFSRTSGTIMSYLNSDDILLPGTLNFVADYFTKNPDIDVVYGHRIIIDENDMEIGRWVLPPHNSDVLSWADFIPQETLFWRRSIWEKAGGKVDETLQFAMDWDLLLRFRDCGAKFARLPRFLGAFRVHQNQKTSLEISDKGSEEMHFLRNRSLGRFVTTKEIKLATRSYLKRHLIYHKLYRAGILSY